MLLAASIGKKRVCVVGSATDAPKHTAVMQNLNKTMICRSITSFVCQVVGAGKGHSKLSYRAEVIDVTFEKGKDRFTPTKHRE